MKCLSSWYGSLQPSYVPPWIFLLTLGIAGLMFGWFVVQEILNG